MSLKINFNCSKLKAIKCIERQFIIIADVYIIQIINTYSAIE